MEQSKSKEAPRFLALICARGGSKGLKDKNILNFAGKPLIQWSVEAALNAAYISDVVVSTDSTGIRDAALSAGARVPFLRPAELATDTSDQNDAIVHALEWLQVEEENYFDFLVLLQPTQPLRRAGFVDQAIQKFLSEADGEDDTLVCVSRADSKLAYIMRAENGLIDFAIDQKNLSSNRQEVEQFYLPAGTLYIAPVKTFLNHKTFYNQSARYLEVDGYTATDIDTAEDFEKALEAFKKFNT